MHDEIVARRSYELIQKDMALTEPCDWESSDDPFNSLHQFLTAQVQYLLDHDFAKLLDSMYRIDIPEHQLKVILEGSKPPEIASHLSEAIILREKQKVITRDKYRPK